MLSIQRRILTFLFFIFFKGTYAPIAWPQAQSLPTQWHITVLHGSSRAPSPLTVNSFQPEPKKEKRVHYQR